MEILSILEVLEDVIEQSVTVPFSSKSLFDKTQILEIIKEARLKLPEDIKQALWIRGEHSRIIKEAEEQAQSIIEEAENRLTTLINDHEITKKACDQANDIVVNAKKSAREIKSGTKEYADEILLKVQQVLAETLNVVKMNRDELK